MRSDISLKLASSFSLSCWSNLEFWSCISSKAWPVTSISLRRASSSCLWFATCFWRAEHCSSNSLIRLWASSSAKRFFSSFLASRTRLSSTGQIRNSYFLAVCLRCLFTFNQVKGSKIRNNYRWLLKGPANLLCLKYNRPTSIRWISKILYPGQEKLQR